jgi:hypothetical protein
VSTQPRSADSARFHAAHDPLTLIEVVVPAVARSAAGPGGDPWRVSQRAYDQARAQAGFPDSPTAQACARRLTMRWPEALSLAFSSDRDLPATLGAASRRDERPQMAPEIAADAIRTVATYGGADELDPVLYDRLRDELVIRDRRAWRHGGGLDVTLPTSSQIRIACRNPNDREGWVSALSLAGLAKPRTSRGSVAVDVALEWFLQDAGWLPRSRDTLILYAKARGFAVVDHVVLAEHLQVLHARRSAQGLWTPQPIPVGSRRPRFEVRVLERASRAAYVQGATYATILDALLSALEVSDGALTQDAYQAWSAGRPAAPSLRLVQRIARQHRKTFAEVRSEAIRMRVHGARSVARANSVVLDPDRVGEKAIVIEPPRPKGPRLAGRVGRPRSYATVEERRETVNARRRELRAERANGRSPTPVQPRGSRYASPEEERAAANARRRATRSGRPAQNNGGRRRFKRADGKRIAWVDLIHAGIVAADTELHATRAGRRFACRYVDDHFEVDGLGRAKSLTGAATLALNGPQDGWTFWRVGPAPGTPVFKLRRQLLDASPTAEA